MKIAKSILILFLLGTIAPKALAADTNNINDVNTVAAGNTQFAFDIYSKLKIGHKANLFFSPYSISTALALTYGGALGETKEQMAKVLHWTLPDSNLYSAFGALQKQLIEPDKSRGYELLVANALWLQRGEPFLREFLDLNQNYYGAGFKQVDFIKETEKTRQTINSWVAAKTKNNIINLIPPNGVDPATVLVLTNAIYFKGDWQTKFEKKDTHKDDFFTKGNKIKVEMMHIKEKYKYYADEKMQVLEVPYKSNELSMLIFLPKKINGLPEIEDTLSTEKLDTIVSKMWRDDVKVYFPKFKMIWETSLKETLINLGMSGAFGNADFSGINGKGGIWISDVLHKAYVKVNEEGTEAAAATAVIVVRSIGSHKIEPVFRADHPFIFIIKDNRSGSILFIGRLMNPTE